MEERPIIKSRAFRVFQNISQELSLHRDIFDQLAPFSNLRRVLSLKLIWYYVQSLAMTGAAVYILRSEVLALRVFLCGALLSSYLLNGQLRYERDILFRAGMTDQPGAEEIRRLYIARAAHRWPGFVLAQYQSVREERLAKFLPRPDPLRRFAHMPELKTLLEKQSS